MGRQGMGSAGHEGSVAWGWRGAGGTGNRAGRIWGRRVTGAAGHGGRQWRGPVGKGPISELWMGKSLDVAQDVAKVQ